MPTSNQDQRGVDVLIQGSQQKVSKMSLLSDRQVKLWKVMLVGLFVAGFVAAIAFAVGTKVGRETIPQQESEAAGLPVNVELLASPAQIQAGQSTTLTWSSANAADCKASGSWSGLKPVNGSEIVVPSQTSTYSMICRGLKGAESSANNVGSSSAVVTVVGVQPPVPGSLGTVSNVKSIKCPSGFYAKSKCSQATVSCSGTANIQVTYGSFTPQGNVKGTIIMHRGGGGVDAFNQGPSGSSKTYPTEYIANGYRIVQLAWASDWEDTGLPVKNIKTAACRPATLLNHVYQTIHGGTNTQGAMCAQGHSGGSGALGYALAWYGADSYLDHVMLSSGPVFGDIEAGCKVPDEPPVTICGVGQLGCASPSWTVAPQYAGSPTGGMVKWTGDASCQNKSNIPTSAESNSNWKNMSIDDGSGNADYLYPNTSLSGWLCDETAVGTVNNAPAQGQYFYRQIGSTSQVPSYSLNRIVQCGGSEEIWDGYVYGNSSLSGFDATVNDMVQNCVKRH